MDTEKLFKKGNPAKGSDGTLLLVNEENSAFSVNEAIIMIWDMCDGLSFDELVTNIASNVGQDANTLRTPIENLINELNQAKLVEIKAA